MLPCSTEGQARRPAPNPPGSEFAGSEFAGPIAGRFGPDGPAG